MATESAKNLKKKYEKMPTEFFEQITFGELAVGDNFIGFPVPGDNDGHGGYRGAHRLFKKTKKTVTNAAPGLRYGISHGQAVCTGTNQDCDFPKFMPVILIT